MTLQIIAQRLLTIESLWSTDAEGAQCKDAQLRQDVLAFIASGKCPDPAAFAAAVLCIARG